MVKKKAEWALEVVQSRTELLKGSLAETISLDEMWTYANVRKGPNRNSVWIWTAVVDDDHVVFEVGDRSEQTLIRLCDRLPVAKRYHTDGYEAYNWLPRNQHEVGKYGKVNHNESLHSRFRDRLRRLARKTKGYTKSVAMLRGSLALVCLYLGLI